MTPDGKPRRVPERQVMADVSEPIPLDMDAIRAEIARMRPFHARRKCSNPQCGTLLTSWNKDRLCFPCRERAERTTGNAAGPLPTGGARS